MAQEELIMKNRTLSAILLVFSIFLSSCGPGQLFGPTITPTPTSTSTPTLTPTNTLTLTPTNTLTPTSTNTPTNTPTSTATSTPEPICNPGTTVLGSIDDDLREYVDIVDVSTTLEENKFSVIFTLREIPEEITINLEDTENGWPEIGWGVAIDVDNDPDTGWETFMTNTGYGYDKILQAFYFKQAGSERTGEVQNLFRFNTAIWNVKDGGGISKGTSGTISVDIEANTITLSANIPGMTADSYLYFFAFHIEEGQQIFDELCVRW